MKNFEKEYLKIKSLYESQIEILDEYRGINRSLVKKNNKLKDKIDKMTLVCLAYEDLEKDLIVQDSVWESDSVPTEILKKLLAIQQMRNEVVYLAKPIDA